MGFVTTPTSGTEACTQVCDNNVTYYRSYSPSVGTLTSKIGAKGTCVKDVHVSVGNSDK